MKNSLIAGALALVAASSFNANADEPKIGAVEHCEGTRPVFYDEGPEGFEIASDARLTQKQAEQYCRVIQNAPAPGR
jgi:hypothetical protein